MVSLAFACAHSGGACHRRSSVVRVAVRIVARACACSSLAGARVFGRCRSCRAAQRAAAPAAWWAADTRAPLCGPLVASRHPGDLKIATNPHYIHLGPIPVSIELRGAEFQKPSTETQFHKILLRGIFGPIKTVMTSHSPLELRTTCCPRQPRRSKPLDC